MICYKKGYKYQLARTYICHVDIYPSQIIKTRFITLDTTGLLTICWGYAWDGPSGPTIDTKSFMRGSLIHDVLYQLMRIGMLGLWNREAADKELRRICLEDKMNPIRAWYVYHSVRKFARSAALPENKKIEYCTEDNQVKEK